MAVPMAKHMAALHRFVGNVRIVFENKKADLKDKKQYLKFYLEGKKINFKFDLEVFINDIDDKFGALVDKLEEKFEVSSVNLKDNWKALIVSSKGISKVFIISLEHNSKVLIVDFENSLDHFVIDFNGNLIAIMQFIADLTRKVFKKNHHEPMLGRRDLGAQPEEQPVIKEFFTFMKDVKAAVKVLRDNSEDWKYFLNDLKNGQLMDVAINVGVERGETVPSNELLTSWKAESLGSDVLGFEIKFKWQTYGGHLMLFIVLPFQIWKGIPERPAYKYVSPYLAPMADEDPAEEEAIGTQWLGPKRDSKMAVQKEDAAMNDKEGILSESCFRQLPAAYGSLLRRQQAQEHK